MIEQEPQAGAAGPERRDSPLQTGPERSFELPRKQVSEEAAGCWSNGVPYPEGANVTSGPTRLRRERGIRVEVGERRP